MPDLHPVTIGGKSGQAAYFTDRSFHSMTDDPSQAQWMRVRFEDGSYSVYQTAAQEPRSARHIAKETEIHAAADAHVDAIKAAVLKAFKTGREAINGPLLRQALKNKDREKAERILAPVAGVVKTMLVKALPDLIGKTHTAGGHAAVDMLKQPRTAEGFRAAKVSIDWGFDDEDPDAQAWILDHGAELVTDIDKTTKQDIQAALMKAFDADEDTDVQDLVDEIADAVGDEDRAMLIARTETMKAASEGQRNAWRQAVNDDQLDGDMQREWITVGDNKVCPVCEDLEGETADMDGEYPDPGGEGPPQHPNCLPGHCFVLPGSEIAAVSKRWFDGDLIVIRVSGDRELTCTPNHPILTPYGWIAAGLLDVGSDVICDGRRQWRGFQNSDYQEVPTAIEDIANTAVQTPECWRTFLPVPTAAEDFHGDGGGSQVAIIWANRSLVFSDDTTVRQSLLQGDFKSRGLVGELPTDGHVFQHISGFNATTNSVVSSPDLINSDIRRHTGPFDHFLLGLTPHRDATLDQPTSNEGTASAKLAGQLQDGRACEVFTDQVIFIQRFAWRGHVYNLETEDGWYAAGGIITHNCRCTEGLGAPAPKRRRRRGKR